MFNFFNPPAPKPRLSQDKIPAKYAQIDVYKRQTHPLYRGEVDYKLFDEIPLQLFERNIFYTVFVFEERGKPVPAFAVIVIARIGAVFAHTFEEPCKVFVEGLQQQAAVFAHTEEGVAYFFGRNIRITVAEPLVLLADIGLDVYKRQRLTTV